MAVSSSSSSLTENFSSPFFLNNVDNPGAMLVSQPLTGSNYNTWSRSIIVSLTTKNKMAFIEGSLPKPSPEDEAMFHAWTRCNNMIITWFLDSVSKEIASSDNLSVSDYFTKIRTFGDELDNYDLVPSYTYGGMRSVHEKHNRDHVFQFLMGLDDSFAKV
ncbi:uncharacterized protein LOC133851504 [Alnus glutinosa]|uniref:uncharacterized protein LOC133851504 n=1 Tax=Alnus glutinosa TaxID=3517 RepID=UPI002D77C835|nr:uncharacterized protein LOC133851504 [Alnus glutinosa]